MNKAKNLLKEEYLQVQSVGIIGTNARSLKMMKRQTLWRNFGTMCCYKSNF